MKTYSGYTTVRMPADLHEQLSELARRNGVSLNTFLIYLLSRGVTMHGGNNDGGRQMKWD